MGGCCTTEELVEGTDAIVDMALPSNLHQTPVCNEPSPNSNKRKLSTSPQDGSSTSEPQPQELSSGYSTNNFCIKKRKVEVTYPNHCNLQEVNAAIHDIDQIFGTVRAIDNEIQKLLDSRCENETSTKHEPVLQTTENEMKVLNNRNQISNEDGLKALLNRNHTENKNGMKESTRHEPACNQNDDTSRDTVVLNHQKQIDNKNEQTPTKTEPKTVINSTKATVLSSDKTINNAPPCQNHTAPKTQKTLNDVLSSLNGVKNIQNVSNKKKKWTKHGNGMKKKKFGFAMSEWKPTKRMINPGTFEFIQISGNSSFISVPNMNVGHRLLNDPKPLIGGILDPLFSRLFANHFGFFPAGDPTILEVLSPDHFEVQNVIKSFKSTGKFLQIRRLFKINNAFLQMHYLLKRIEYGLLYGHENVQEKVYFHGTSAKYAQNISIKNFDWRFYRSEKIFGRGVNFTPLSSYARHYCDNNDSVKLIFAANVLHCRTFNGNRSTYIPPYYDSTRKIRFDTAKKPDDTVFVKFNEDEFYPSYAIEFTEY